MHSTSLCGVAIVVISAATGRVYLQEELVSKIGIKEAGQLSMICESGHKGENTDDIAARGLTEELGPTLARDMIDNLVKIRNEPFRFGHPFLVTGYYVVIPDEFEAAAVQPQDAGEVTYGRWTDPPGFVFLSQVLLRQGVKLLRSETPVIVRALSDRHPGIFQLPTSADSQSIQEAASA